MLCPWEGREKKLFAISRVVDSEFSKYIVSAPSLYP